MQIDRYCVNKNAQANGDHEIHITERHYPSIIPPCPFLPKEANQVDLGLHGDYDCAVGVAKSLHKQWKVDGCSHCCKSGHKS